ncbi:hypothetical protein HE1_00395 [Holospora elegans E1]|uniref:Uncharacterized protein n=1 Tax=Holospora elegans E1 TaxID=1427503 RepID=A0A023DY11_9PROT|nr:hypothetical protein [Holospora elegans]GAJ46074.1 hypothetical protein HE1_00395 [Holospora elegans E1]
MNEKVIGALKRFKLIVSEIEEKDLDLDFNLISSNYAMELAKL